MLWKVGRLLAAGKALRERRVVKARNWELRGRRERGLDSENRLLFKDLIALDCVLGELGRVGRSKIDETKEPRLGNTLRSGRRGLYGSP
jgi:hypothetical protein